MIIQTHQNNVFGHGSIGFNNIALFNAPLTALGIKIVIFKKKKYHYNMKNSIPILFLSSCISLSSLGQARQLVADQNPQYMQSQNKYMAMADSLTAWHATTLQNTYKAYDFFEAKAERKAERRDFRRTLRLERARRLNYFDPYNNQYYNNRNSFWYNPYNNFQYRRRWW
ncbi:MAG: hypothetical protein IPJ81_15590 [Chitinophagaceae bacterium]|nr:hypothetical protein [Chitinophagaceae bacterium]